MTAPPGLSVSPSPYSLFRQSSASSLLLHGPGSRSPSSPDDPHNVKIPDHFESPPVGRMQGTISDTEELALIASPHEVLQNRSSLHGDVQGMSSEEFGLACDVIYENQRGLFFCGVPYFSASTLFPFDPTPWTIFRKRPDHAPIHSMLRQTAGHDPATAYSRRHCPSGCQRQHHSPPLAARGRGTAQAISVSPFLQGTPFTPASFQLPSPAWHWTSRWSIIIGNEGTTDEHGWEYNWVFKNTGWKSRLNELGWAGYVRRRKWTRTREYQEPIEVELNQPN